MDAKEKTGIRRFVCDQLRDEPDLSTLTLRILKKRYLERVQCDSLSPEVKHFLKQVVEEALIKMQENDENDSELETKKSQNKRKRKDEVLSGGEDEDESTAKKPRRRSSPSSEEKVLVEKKNNDSDSDASSLTSLDEEQNNGKENTPADKKKKATKKVEKKEKSASGPKGNDASVVRLKRYITLCGVKLNYKKVLEDCHSVRSQVAVLKKQLEDLGVDGQPSIKKCRKIKMKREETQEQADLDVSNIIATEESEVKKDCKTGSDDSEEEEKVKSEDEKKEVKKSQRTTNEKSKPQISSEKSSDEEMNESENKGKESSCEDSPQEKAIKKTDATKNGESGSSDASKGKKTPQSDEEDEPDTESESEKSEQMKDKDPSDDSEKEEKVLVEKKNNDSDSDASSLTSLDEEQNNGKENTPADKKKKATKKVEKKEKSASGPKGNDLSVVRLKRYITLCGVRLNYKKLLKDCHSVRSQVAVLKKQLEDLGVDRQPSIKKCRKIKMKREDIQELADLDVSNIIATEGRPKRRGTSAWKERQDFPSSTYLRTVNTGSDSDEENKPNRGRKRATDWANLQGIISDDADSN
ncbi:HIRA-interacting protein 3 isoform X3 [Trematomus bernacchii]|uniref:HIRA-interacting protein 3 isoform X3 n=1 Tax=Trematomus bernacchii TaxID=40690 RepID=UPI00146BC933|nr:HIRA-interacting protein 3 isoform X3 [Trematomus bernacchii]